MHLFAVRMRLRILWRQAGRRLLQRQEYFYPCRNIFFYGALGLYQSGRVCLSYGKKNRIQGSGRLVGTRTRHDQRKNKGTSARASMLLNGSSPDRQAHCRKTENGRKRPGDGDAIEIR